MILYFSAEGNSQFVAKSIASAANDHIFSMRKAVKEQQYEITIEDGEDLGLVFPVYFHYLPTIVTDYLHHLQIHMKGDDHYVYAVATYGMAYGNVGSAVKEIFWKKGIALNASYAVRMVDTWNPYFDMTDKAYISEMEETGNRQLNEVMHSVKNHENTLLKDTWTNKEQEDTLASYEEYRDSQRFHVDTAKCIGCGLCVRQCPLNRIHLEAKHPVWDGEKCTLCLGCVHRCPKNAIDYMGDTIGHGQYINRKAGVIQ